MSHDVSLYKYYQNAQGDIVKCIKKHGNNYIVQGVDEYEKTYVVNQNGVYDLDGDFGDDIHPYSLVTEVTYTEEEKIDESAPRSIDEIYLLELSGSPIGFFTKLPSVETILNVIQDKCNISIENLSDTEKESLIYNQNISVELRGNNFIDVFVYFCITIKSKTYSISKVQKLEEIL